MRDMPTALLLAVTLAFAQPFQESSPRQLPSKEQKERKQATTSDFELAGGTAIQLRFVRTVSSSQVIAGDKVELEVVEPIVMNGCVIIQKGSVTEAAVMMAQAKRSMGRGGNLELKLESVKLADGEIVPVRAVKDVKGQGREGAVAAGLITGAVFAVPLIIAYTVQGKSAIVPKGTELTAYVAETLTLERSKFLSDDGAPGRNKAER